MKPGSFIVTISGLIFLILSLTAEGAYFPYGNIVIFILAIFSIFVGLYSEEEE